MIGAQAYRGPHHLTVEEVQARLTRGSRGQVFPVAGAKTTGPLTDSEGRVLDPAFLAPHLAMLNGGSAQVVATYPDDPHIRFDVGLSSAGPRPARKPDAHPLFYGSHWPYKYPEEIRARVVHARLKVQMLDALLWRSQHGLLQQSEVTQGR
jgi:hypothetical protein